MPPANPDWPLFQPRADGEPPAGWETRYGIESIAVSANVLTARLRRPLDPSECDALEFLSGKSLQSELIEVEGAAGIASSIPAVDSVSANPDAEGSAIAQVQSVIADAWRRRASDIHFEPRADRLRIRFRIDGVLDDALDLPRDRQAAVISRLKILGGLSLAERRVPQDGRLRATVEGRSIDLRVSSLPTLHGETLVLRILPGPKRHSRLEDLGLDAHDAGPLAKLARRPDGLVLVAGPTGSGKTTTLYSILQGFDPGERKVITVEDPVEYQLAGVNQVQVRAELGLTFASALRAMLRQAPDVIMVGEIRDRETAAIALQAALTGHLVLSTLHAGDSVEAIIRLFEMGLPPYLVAGALRGVVAQRLVRRVCPQCGRPVQLREDEARLLRLTPPRLAAANCRAGSGCAACAGTGFRGRIGLFEIFYLDENLQNRVAGRPGRAELGRAAREAGVRTLREDGAVKVTTGLTTAAEVVSITADGNAPALDLATQESS